MYLIKYLINTTFFKIISLFFYIILKTHENFIFIKSKNNAFKQKKKILIFLDDQKIFHIGDKLFFLPLIIALSEKFKLVIIDKNKSFQSIFENLNLDYQNDLPENLHDYLIISYLKSYKYFVFKKNISFIGVEFPRAKLIKSMYPYLFQIFNNLLSIDININKDYLKDFKNLFKKSRFKDLDLTKINQYYIFNNDIISRYLNVYFLDKNKLMSYASQFSKKYPIIFVSQFKNKSKLPQNFIDLTSETEFYDVVNLISHKKCLGTISFDNMFVHLSTIFDKEIHYFERYLSKKKGYKMNLLFIPFISNSYSIIKKII